MRSRARSTRQFPHKPLFPADPAQRRAVEDAERWGEELQNGIRRVFYCIARRDPAAFTSLMSPDRMLPMRAALRVSRGLIIRLATGAHRATDVAAMDDLAVLPERLDQIDAWLEQGVLGGEQLNAADFQIARQRRGDADVRGPRAVHRRAARWRPTRAASHPTTTRSWKRSCRTSGSRRCARTRPPRRAPGSRPATRPSRPR